MIQRIQTIWLIAAAACAFLTLKLPFYIGSIGATPAADLNATSNTLIMILTVAAAVLALLTVFLYKNRSLQLKLVFAGMIISIVNIVLYVLQVRKYDTGGIALFCVFTFAIPVFFILASRGIYKDEKLVKGLDRLR